MWIRRITVPVIVVAILASTAIAQAKSADAVPAPRAEVSILGGAQALEQNDTALPDRFFDIPVVATGTYRLTPNVAVEGEFTWIIPVSQSVDVAGTSEDRKTPNILAYQANLRADLPRGAWSPYLVGGAGAMTFLSNDDADRMPQLAESQTAFAINFGTGVTYRLTGRWGLRADLREFVAFPSETAAGLSDSSGADTIWMERGTLGLSVRF